jgi:hypothetical protein
MSEQSGDHSFRVWRFNQQKLTRQADDNQYRTRRISTYSDNKMTDTTGYGVAWQR